MTSFTHKGVVANPGQFAYGLAAADFDGDGDMDFISGDGVGEVELFLNNGTASFGYYGIISDVGHYAFGLAAADFA